ncbi:hypothetical protein D1872_243700 [compost metagenome]
MFDGCLQYGTDHRHRLLRIRLHVPDVLRQDVPLILKNIQRIPIALCQNSKLVCILLALRDQSYQPPQILIMLNAYSFLLDTTQST